MAQLGLRLPLEHPYSLVEITGYDPHDKRAAPDPDVWPAAVARKLNENLGTDYSARFGSPEPEHGRTR